MRLNFFKETEAVHYISKIILKQIKHFNKGYSRRPETKILYF